MVRGTNIQLITVLSATNTTTATVCQNVGIPCVLTADDVFIFPKEVSSGLPLSITLTSPLLHLLSIFLNSRFEGNPWSRLKYVARGNNASILKEKARKGRFCWLHDTPSAKLLFRRQIYCHLQAFLGDCCGRKPSVLKLFLF